MAAVLLWSGRAEESLPWIDKALADESVETSAYLLTRKCGANMYLGRYDEAVAACEKSAGLYTVPLTYVYLTAAYVQRGDDAKAMAAKKQLLKLWPEVTLARFRSLAPSDNPVYLQARETNLFGGLRKAGVPEK
jgi:tetratricopeptide (TPR) repeat protein